MKKIIYNIKLLIPIIIVLGFYSCIKKRQTVQPDKYNDIYSIKYFPIPCTDVENVIVHLDLEQQVKINLSDKVKGSVEVFNKNLPAGSNWIDIDFTNKPSGIYYMEVIVGEYIHRKTIIKN